MPAIEEFLPQWCRFNVYKQHAIADIHFACISSHHRAQNLGPGIDDAAFKIRLLQVVLSEEIEQQVGYGYRRSRIHFFLDTEDFFDAGLFLGAGRLIYTRSSAVGCALSETPL